jgi:hypothetical protein
MESALGPPRCSWPGWQGDLVKSEPGWQGAALSSPHGQLVCLKDLGTEHITTPIVVALALPDLAGHTPSPGQVHLFLSQETGCQVVSQGTRGRSRRRKAVSCGNRDMGKPQRVGQ